jgi:HAD superfamily phosphoserine phosphatase-like hydrolase
MSDPSKPALVIFDLCETLYAENTTLGFVRFFQGRHGSRYSRALIETVYSRRSPVFYLLAAIHRFGYLDLFRWATARSLKGCDRAKLAEAARAYATEVLPRKAISVTQNRMAEHRAAGDRVVIVSNSLDVVVEAVAGIIGIEGYSSRLGYQGDHCNGRIEHDLTGRKAAVVAKLVQDQPASPVIHAYTDNLSDRDLVLAADRPTIIIPAGRTRTGWGDIDAVFIEL